MWKHQCLLCGRCTTNVSIWLRVYAKKYFIHVLYNVHNIRAYYMSVSVNTYPITATAEIHNTMQT